SGSIVVECDQLGKRVLEIIEPPRPYRFGPLRFDFEHSCTMDVDRLPTSASEKYETPRAAFLRPAFDIAEALQLTDQVICGLLGHVDALCQIAKTDTIWMGVHKHIEESLVEITEA